MKTKTTKITVLTLLVAIVCCAALLPIALKASPVANASVVSAQNSADFEYDAVDNTVITGFSASYKSSAAYTGNNYIDLVIPEGTTGIAAGAFRSENKIIRVTLPESLNSATAIGEEAFRNCYKLVEVCYKSDALGIQSSWETGHTEAGYVAFNAVSIYKDSAEATSHITTQDDFLFVTNNNNTAKWLLGYVGSQTDIQLPAGTYNIYRSAFQNNTAIASVGATNNPVIEEVGEMAFFQCTNLQTVVLPNSVKTIGVSAFANDTALVSCNVPTSLVTVSGEAFGGCSNLQGVMNFPASIREIGVSAFESCAKIDGVMFAEGTPAIVIGRRAFYGCKSENFSMISLPNQSAVGLEAFVDTALEFVYLPADIDFRTGTTERYFNETRTKLIAQDLTGYNHYAQMTGAIAAHASQMTYVINVTFVGNDGQDPVVIKKLAGETYAYTENSGLWAQDAAAALPLQQGYSRSVWYAEATFQNVVDLDGVSQAIASAKTNKTPSLTYYAKYFDKATIAAGIETIEAPEYSNSKEYTPERFIVGVLDNGTLPESILPAGVHVAFDDDPLTVQNAGDYTLLIQLDAANGAWVAPISLPVSIKPLVVTINDAFTWSGQSSGQSFPLLSNTLYIYKNASDERIYSSSVIGNLETISANYVTNAIAEKRAGSITVSMSLNNNYGGDLTVAHPDRPDNDRVSAATGEHKAIAIVSANDNYRLQVTDAIPAGVALTLLEDGTVMVAKDWYLVDVSNPLITGDAAWLTGWTYNAAPANMAAPTLTYNNGEETYNQMTFDLIKDANTENSLAFNGISYANFNNYINETMPVGKYQLTVHVPQVTSGGLTYFYYPQMFEFVVAPGVFDAQWAQDAASLLVSKELQNIEGTMQLYSKTGANAVDLKVWKAFENTDFNPERDPSSNNIWARSGYDRLYSDRYYLKFNVLGMNTTDYFTFKELNDNSSLLKPNTVGTYVIYYQIEANNYEPLVDLSTRERYDYSFTITIYDLLVAPTLGQIIYSGEPYEVAQTELYSVEKIANDDYTSAGQHSVKLISNNYQHHRWLQNGNTVNQIVFSFNIERAQNTIQQKLTLAGTVEGGSMPGWQFGTYDAAVNIPSWSTRFHDGTESFYSYKLVGANNVEYTLEQFGSAPIGSYKLVATAKGYVEGDSTTNSYNWNVCTSSIDIAIAKTANGWLISPSVIVWQYKGFDIAAKLIRGEAIANRVIFKVASDEQGTAVEGLEAFYLTNEVVSQEIAEILNNLPAGNYWLIAQVESNPNYSDVNAATIPFRIMPADNGWETAPTIEAWRAGKYDADKNFPEAKALFGEVVIRIYEVNNPQNVIYDSVEKINNMAIAKPGDYIMTADVAAQSDYVDISDFVSFTIFEKEGLAWWVTLLIVVGALGVTALIFGMLHRYGVLQMLSGKVVLALRTRATLDATIAAVRAQKRTEDVKKDWAREKIAQARAEAERQKNLPMDEQAALLEERAQKMAAKSDRLKARAEKYKSVAQKQSAEQNVEPENTPDDAE